MWLRFLCLALLLGPAAACSEPKSARIRVIEVEYRDLDDSAFDTDEVPADDDTAADGDLDRELDIDTKGGPPAGVNWCEAWELAKPVPATMIRNGVRGPTAFSISQGVRQAVVAIQEGSDRGGWSTVCTGSLVTGRVVVTAAHCTASNGGTSTTPEPASQFRVAFGVDSRRPLAASKVTSVAIHPRYSAFSGAFDFSVLVLSDDARTKLPGVGAVTFSTDNPTSRVGTTAEAVGYGWIFPDPSRGRNDLRWWIAQPIASVSTSLVTIDGGGAGSVCNGDSGSPLLVPGPAGPTALGTLHGGDEECVGINYYARSDTAAAWLGERLAAAPAEACGLLTAGGVCDGAVRRWCDNGAPAAEDCAAGNRVCATDNAGNAGCTADPCAGGTRRAWCRDGDLLAYCQGGYTEFHCGFCGRSCVESGDDAFCR